MSSETERSKAAALRVCEEWPRLSLEDWRGLFAAKAVYRNIPMPGETIGPDAIHEFLKGAIAVYDVKCDTLSVVGDERRVASWRRRQLLEVGFPRALAARLADDHAYDLHALIELVERGCPPELAVRILAPLDREDA